MRSGCITLSAEFLSLTRCSFPSAQLVEITSRAALITERSLVQIQPPQPIFSSTYLLLRDNLKGAKRCKSTGSR